VYKLKKWRKDHNVSQQTLGRLLGLTKQQYGRIENGQFKLKPEYVLILEKFTGISRYDLRPDIYGREPPSAVQPDVEAMAS